MEMKEFIWKSNRAALNFPYFLKTFYEIKTKHVMLRDFSTLAPPMCNKSFYNTIEKSLNINIKAWIYFPVLFFFLLKHVNKMHLNVLF